MSELNPQPLPPRERPVIVHVPSEVLGDLATFQKVHASVLERAGCQACTSGIDITWKLLEEELVVTPDLQIEPVLRAGRRFG